MRVLKCTKYPIHKGFRFKAIVREFGVCDEHGDHVDTLETYDWEAFEFTCAVCDATADFVTVEED